MQRRDIYPGAQNHLRQRLWAGFEVLGLEHARYKFSQAFSVISPMRDSVVEPKGMSGSPT